MGAHSFHLETPYGSLYFSGGNSKVKVPVFNVGAATDCPHKATCSFSFHNKGDWKAGVCYAQRTETIYSTVLNARRKNEEVLRLLNQSDDMEYHASRLAEYMMKICRKRQVKYVRFNESSDLAGWNIRFLSTLSKALVYRGIRPYGYSKSSPELREIMTSAGCLIRESEVDFVAVDSAADIPDSDSVDVCPGVGCGVTCCKCQRSFKKIYIVKH